MENYMVLAGLGFIFLIGLWILFIYLGVKLSKRFDNLFEDKNVAKTFKTLSIMATVCFAQFGLIVTYIVIKVLENNNTNKK